jgi:hypothetical protein
VNGLSRRRISWGDISLCAFAFYTVVPPLWSIVVTGIGVSGLGGMWRRDLHHTREVHVELYKTPRAQNEGSAKMSFLVSEKLKG